MNDSACDKNAIGTNWDDFLKSLRPEYIGELIQVEYEEWSRCGHCPEGCKKFCERCMDENDKRCRGVPYDKAFGDICDCKDIFCHWASQKTTNKKENKK